MRCTELLRAVTSGASAAEPGTGCAVAPQSVSLGSFAVEEPSAPEDTPKTFCLPRQFQSDYLITQFKAYNTF